MMIMNIAPREDHSAVISFPEDSCQLLGLLCSLLPQKTQRAWTWICNKRSNIIVQSLLSLSHSATKRIFILQQTKVTKYLKYMSPRKTENMRRKVRQRRNETMNIHLVLSHLLSMQSIITGWWRILAMFLMGRSNRSLRIPSILDPLWINSWKLTLTLLSSMSSLSPPWLFSRIVN